MKMFLYDQMNEVYKDCSNEIIWKICPVKQYESDNQDLLIIFKSGIRCFIKFVTENKLRLVKK